MSDDLRTLRYRRVAMHMTDEFLLILDVLEGKAPGYALFPGRGK